MAKWQATTYPGVRYREHKERRHGIKKDRYFSIYYRLDGKRKEEGLGWASEGWSANKAHILGQSSRKRISQAKAQGL